MKKKEITVLLQPDFFRRGEEKNFLLAKNGSTSACDSQSSQRQISMKH
jgi:hypothetical protein